MDIQLIASIVGGLIFAYFISDEENKPENKRNKYYANYGRPVVKGILKSRGVDLSDEYIKDIHKTLMSALKERGISEFHKHVTPEIEKKLSRGLKELDSNSSDDEIKKLSKTIVKDFLKTQGVQELRTKYTKTKPQSKLSKSLSDMGTDSLRKVQKKNKARRIIQFEDQPLEPRVESAFKPTSPWANLRDSLERGSKTKKRKSKKQSRKRSNRTRKR